MEVPSAAESVACSYCHAPIRIDRRRIALAIPRLTQPPTQVLYTQKSSSAILFIVLCSIFFFAVCPIGIFLLINTMSGPHLQWDATSEEGIWIGPIDEDPAEDFLGRVRILEEGHSTLWIAAYEGKSFERLWLAGPFGGDMTAVHYGVSGNRALVSDSNRQAHLLDLRSGKEIATFSLSDKATDICGVLGQTSRLFVETADHTNLHVENDTGRGSPARPDGCSTYSIKGRSCWSARFPPSPLSQDCLQKGMVPAVLGFAPDRQFREGGILVGLGHKSPGSREPMLAGFNEKTQNTLWVRKLSENASEKEIKVADLLDGIFYAGYGAKDGSIRVCAITARTGKTLWDSEAALKDKEGRHDLDALTVSKGRLYLRFWTWLFVFDAKSGQQLAKIGRWIDE
jgi:outer membrane protein assembly factor BamB